MNKCKAIILRMFRRPANKLGWTIFAPLKIVPEYTVDLEKGLVTGTVKHNEKIYLTVTVDVFNKTTRTKGNLTRMYKYTKPFTKKHYIEMIKDEAASIIDNQIINPEK